MEQLVEELVDPKSSSSPARIERIQKEIQQLQRQPAGWQLGLELLRKNSSQLRFYGALTLTIKIRTDSEFLETHHELRNAVLTTLIGSYVAFTNQLEQTFVLRKVCSTLAAFAICPQYTWRFPLRHVMISLCRGHVVEHKDLDDFQEVWVGLQGVTAPQLRSVLWLSSAMLEEVEKHDGKLVQRLEYLSVLLLPTLTSASAKLASRAAENALDSWYLVYLTLRGLHVKYGFSDPNASFLPDHLAPSPQGDLLELSKAALDAITTWTSFQNAHNTYDDSTVAIEDAVMILVVRCFSVSPIAENAISCLTTIVEHAPQYLTRKDPELLTTLLSSENAKASVVTLCQGNYESQATLFVAFLARLLDLYDLTVPQTFDRPVIHLLLGLLQELLQTQGTAVVVDEVCQTVLDAFNQIAESWSDWVGSSPVDELLKPLLNKACSWFETKIQYPPQDSEYPVTFWEPDERMRFQEFRRDVQDFLLSSYQCIGPELIEHLAAPLLLPNVLPGGEDLESQLFCIAAFADLIASKWRELGHYISAVLASRKWYLLISNVNKAPDKARQGAINFISQNAEILQHNALYLLSCVEFLFASLHIRGSTAAASRAISILCHRQRSVLVSALPQFIGSVSILTGVSGEERNRLFGAVAAIIQAVSPEKNKMAPLTELLDLVFRPSDEARLSPGEIDLSPSITLLQTLAAVGKGLRAPSDTPIDLDLQLDKEDRDFWTDGEGRLVQERLRIAIHGAAATWPTETPLIEALCELLKSGYTEVHPSPFKLPASHNAELLARMIRPDLPSIGLVISNASAFIASEPPSNDSVPTEVSLIASQITHFHCALVESFAVTSVCDDHEFTYSSLNFFARMLPRHSGVYFGDKSLSPAWDILFEFSLLPLLNSDTLPRRSAAQFWAMILDLLNSPNEAAHHIINNNLGECLRKYAPRFVASLLVLLGGRAARSELDVLTEPLRKLVTNNNNNNRQGVWAAQMLRDAAIDLGGVGVRRFVEQVIALRGARKTKDVVKEFWIEGKGEAFAYAR